MRGVVSRNPEEPACVAKNFPSLTVGIARVKRQSRKATLVLVKRSALD